MILGLIFLVGSAVIGLGAARRIVALTLGSQRIAVGLTLGLLLQLWLPFALSWAGLGIDKGPYVALLLVVLAAGWWGWRERREFFQLGKNAWETRQSRVVGAMLGAALLVLGYLYYTHSLRPTADGLTSAGISWEDQSGHAMYAASFLYSENLSAFENPHFAGSKLAYPFLSNFLAASLGKLGMSLGQAFWFSGWYAGGLTALWAWVLARDWLGGRLAALAALGLYLLAGGFGFTDFLGYLSSGAPWMEALMKHDYANGWEFKLHYHNVLVAVILPMRSFCFGMPLAMGAIFLVWRSLEAGISRSSRELGCAGVFIGLMPLVNAHTCIIVAWCVLGVFFLSTGYSRMDQLGRLAILFALPILVLALPQLWWTRQQMTGTQAFVHPALGWMAETDTLRSWWEYWVQNGALRILLGVAGWILAGPRLRLLTAPFLALLPLGNVVAFQPFLYDNVKLFVFADLAIAALTVHLFLSWLRRGRAGWLLVAPLVLLITVSGVLSLWRELLLRATVVDWEGVALADLVRANSEPRAVFLTASELTHPVSVLTGRPLLLGYRGWLTNLGLNTDERASEVADMFAAGPRAEELLARHQVKYVVIGPPERREHPNLDEGFFQARAEDRWTAGAFTLYRLKPLTSPAE